MNGWMWAATGLDVAALVGLLWLLWSLTAPNPEEEEDV